MILMGSFIPEIKMRSSAKSIPKRKRGASIKTIRLRKRARMMALIGSDDEINDDTEGSVVDQGEKEPEVVDLCDSDESVSTSTPVMISAYNRMKVKLRMKLMSLMGLRVLRMNLMGLRVLWMNSKELKISRMILMVPCPNYPKRLRIW